MIKQMKKKAPIKEHNFTLGFCRQKTFHLKTAWKINTRYGRVQKYRSHRDESVIKGLSKLPYRRFPPPHFLFNFTNFDFSLF